MTAVGIGLAAGLAIARYRYVQRSSSPVVAQPAQAPVVNDTRTATVQTQKGNEQAQAPVLPEVKIEEKTTVDDTREDDAKTATPGANRKAEKDDTDRSTRDRDDNVRTTVPASTREKKRAGDETEEAQDMPRAQRRERRARDRNQDVDEIPRRVGRASEQINRIREIFEGGPQRP
jgi:hypothetical protein